MTEDLVTFETAKTLNSIGYNGPCVYYYTHDGVLNEFKLASTSLIGVSGLCNIYSKNIYLAPTQSQVRRWLANKDIIISVIYSETLKDYYSKVKRKYTMVQSVTYNTFEEALEEGIKLGLREICTHTPKSQSVWLATDEDGDTYMYPEKPERGIDAWRVPSSGKVQYIHPDILYHIFPNLDLKWEDNPIEVELAIKE